jgi:hypothetical protein
MAKIATQLGCIRISKLVKDDESDTLNLLNEELMLSVQQVLEQLLEEHNVIVEVNLFDK